MAKTLSKMIPLGTLAPDFELFDVTSDKKFKLSDLLEKKDIKAFVIMFICNHCPFVIHVQDELVKLSNEYSEKRISFIAINSNDIESFPDDSPENMKKVAKDKAYKFPYLFDETQEVAKAYGATCTPDFFVFDSAKKLVYRGQLDNSRPSTEIPVTGEDLRNVFDALIENKEIPANQRPSMGCNIKWK